LGLGVGYYVESIGVCSETPHQNVIGYKISNSLWTGLGILSPVTFLAAWLGVSERTPDATTQQFKTF